MTYTSGILTGFLLYGGGEVQALASNAISNAFVPLLNAFFLPIIIVKKQWLSSEKNDFVHYENDNMSKF